MRWKFWRRDEDDDEEFEDEPAAAPRPPPEFPKFALVASEAAVNGWHVAVMVRERANIDYYVRAVVVRWPFVIARPTRSNRQSNIRTATSKLSPASTSPAHKLVVNWAWEPVDDETSQLRFYVRRRNWLWLRRSRRLRVRLTVKEVQPPRRRVVVRLKSNPVAWHRPDPVPKTDRKRRFNVATD